MIDTTKLTPEQIEALLLSANGHHAALREDESRVEIEAYVAERDAVEAA